MSGTPGSRKRSRESEEPDADKEQRSDEQGSDDVSSLNSSHGPNDPLATGEGGSFYSDLVAAALKHRPEPTRLPSESVSKITAGTLEKTVSDSLLASARRLPANRHVRITDENDATGVSSASTFVEFLRSYESLVLEQTRCLEDTCRTIMAAVRGVYQREIDEIAEFSRRNVPCSREKPCNTQTSSAEMQEALWENRFTVTINRKLFAMLVPGFPLFDENDQNAILSSRGIETYLLQRFSAMRNRMLEYPIGKQKQLHVCDVWLKQLEVSPGYTDKIFSMAESFDHLNLNLAESYLAICLSFFRPGPDLPVGNKTLLTFLYAHYLDAFRHLVSSRPGHSSGFFDRLDTAIGRTSDFCDSKGNSAAHRELYGKWLRNA